MLRGNIAHEAMVVQAGEVVLPEAERQYAGFSEVFGECRCHVGDPLERLIMGHADLHRLAREVGEAEAVVARGRGRERDKVGIGGIRAGLVELTAGRRAIQL
jgi:hypothetical protein